MNVELPGYVVTDALRATGDDGALAPAAGEAARVWSGVRLADSRPVVLKVFHPADAPRASREAALVAAVDHPHVLPVLEVVTSADAVAMVTPLASGGDLATLVRLRRRLRWSEALTVLIPLADALAAAHERGVVHGDLSAANVLFDEDGRPLLADLGAARAAAELGGPVAATPTDAAPEIARGAAPSPQADLFSLGSVALRCLSGAPAWPADDLQDVLIESAAGQWPDPSDLLGPPELLAVVRRLLDAEPERRGSAARAAVELRKVGDPEPVELIVTAPDGTVTGPAPATEVRPDAARPPSSIPSRRGRRRGRGGVRGWVRGSSDGRGRRGRHQADRVRARLAGARSGGRPADREGAEPPSDRGAAGPRRRWRQVALVLVVAAVLGTGAVWGGLWWAGWGAVRPSAAPTPTGTGALPAAGSASGDAGTGPSPQSATSPPPAAASTSAMRTLAATTSDTGARAGADDDWLAVVSGLDAARAAALTERDPALLDEVYTAGAPARPVDTRRIAQLTSAGQHVDAAAHHLASVTLLGVGPGGSVRLAVTESQPSYPVRDAAGTVVGATAATGDSVVVMHLTPTDDGFRIDRLQRG